MSLAVAPREYFCVLSADEQAPQHLKPLSLPLPGFCYVIQLPHPARGGERCSGVLTHISLLDAWLHTLLQQKGQTPPTRAGWRHMPSTDTWHQPVPRIITTGLSEGTDSYTHERCTPGYCLSQYNKRQTSRDACNSQPTSRDACNSLPAAALRRSRSRCALLHTTILQLSITAGHRTGCALKHASNSNIRQCHSKQVA